LDVKLQDAKAMSMETKKILIFRFINELYIRKNK
jgi:hypothetical protein